MTEKALEPDIEIRTYFARGKNALVARAEFSELYAAMYLHQLDNGIQRKADEDQLMREALAAITLHCASRPHAETAAWTVSFRSPGANVFVNGDNTLGTVTGTLFTTKQPVKKNVFYADVVSNGKGPRRSVVDFNGTRFFPAVEAYYRQSEQRPARLFQHAEEDFVLIAAQPDCDLEWLENLDEAAVRRLDQDVELSLLERRSFRFECGCHQDRLMQVLAPEMRARPDELFVHDEALHIHCPRCGARHTITREAFEAYLAKEDSNPG